MRWEKLKRDGDEDDNCFARGEKMYGDGVVLESGCWVCMLVGGPPAELLPRDPEGIGRQCGFSMAPATHVDDSLQSCWMHCREPLHPLQCRLNMFHAPACPWVSALNAITRFDARTISPVTRYHHANCPCRELSRREHPRSVQPRVTAPLDFG